MLTKTFLKNLITKSQFLRPVVLIGSQGLTQAVHLEIEAALLAHELIKIRISAPNKELREEMITRIVSHHHATKVKEIGHILIIYRSNPGKKS